MNKTIHQYLRVYYLLTISALFILLSFQFISYNVNDFCQNYIAAKRFVAGDPIYAPLNCWTIPFPTDTQYSAHPPSSLFLYIPLTLFSYRTANYIFDIASLCAYILGGIFLIRLLKTPFLASYTFFLVFSYYWYPFHIANSIHNVSSLLFLLLCVSAYAYHQKNIHIAAYALGIAGLIKLWPLTLLLALYLVGHTSEGKKALLLVMFGWITTIMLIGIPNIQTYVTDVLPNEKYFLADPNNWTISAAIIRPISGYPFMGMTPFFHSVSLEHISLFTSIFSIFCLTALLVLLKRLAQNYPEHTLILLYGYSTLVAFITFPLSWNWNAPILLIPVTLATLLLRNTYVYGPFPILLFVSSILPLLFGQWQTPLTLLGIVDALNPWKTILASWPTACLCIFIWYFVYMIKKSTIPRPNQVDMG